MNLLKTSVLNGVSVVIKTATLFILNKILAVYVGPAGYAIIGQFQNFIQIVTAIGGSAINNGIVKYTSEYNDQPDLQKRMWGTAGKLIILFSLFISLIIIVLSPYLSQIIFHTDQNWSVFVWLAAFLLFFNLNTYLLSILNGKKEITKLVLANICGTLISLLLSSILVVSYGLYGALVALSVFQSVAFIVTLMICRNSDWFNLRVFWGVLDKNITEKLSAFALMAFVSLIAGNIAQFVLRNFMLSHYDWEHAGYWDAMNRLSTGYLMLASTIISVYYLPKLSELKGYKEIQKEVSSGYLVIIPVAIISSILVYVFQDSIINILFTEEFKPMQQLFFWQLIGDVVKIASWIVTYMMLSQAMVKLFISIELFSLLNIIPLTFVCSDLFGFKGVAVAFFLNSLLYWIVCAYFSKLKLRKIYH